MIHYVYGTPPILHFSLFAERMRCCTDDSTHAGHRF